MTNAEKNRMYLNLIDAVSRLEILKAIANHYGMEVEVIRCDVVQDHAQHLLDYMPVSTLRNATALDMHIKGLF